MNAYFILSTFQIHVYLRIFKLGVGFLVSPVCSISRCSKPPVSIDISKALSPLSLIRSTLERDPSNDKHTNLPPCSRFHTETALPRRRRGPTRRRKEKTSCLCSPRVSLQSKARLPPKMKQKSRRNWNQKVTLS